jgi:23S rRNA pseudouridine1911/1915/1917 synthase
VRLDVHLSRRFRDFSRAQFQRFVDKGQVTVNGEHRKSSYVLRSGDVVEADIEIPEPQGVVPENIPLSILYADEDIIVVDKPAGMAVHPGAGMRTGTLVHGLLYHFPDLAGLGDPERPGIVHRLDKDTSGVMVVARNPASYLEMKRKFKAREIKKVYRALAWGHLARAEGSFDWPIGRHSVHGDRMSIRTNKPRTASTEYRVLQEYKDSSLLDVRPITGRTHQIRVHLSAAGHPVAGDRRYGSIRKPGYTFDRLFLHAYHLAFRHPRTGAPMQFTSPLPEALDDILRTLEPRPAPGR